MSEMIMIFIMIFSLVYPKAQYSASPVLFSLYILPPGQTTEQHGINFHMYTGKTRL